MIPELNTSAKDGVSLVPIVTNFSIPSIATESAAKSLTALALMESIHKLTKVSK